MVVSSLSLASIIELIVRFVRACRICTYILPRFLGPFSRIMLTATFIVIIFGVFFGFLSTPISPNFHVIIRCLMILIYTIIGRDIFFIIQLWLKYNHNHFVNWLVFIWEDVCDITVNALSLILSQKKFGLFQSTVFRVLQAAGLPIICSVNSIFSGIYAHLFSKRSPHLSFLPAFGVCAYALHPNVCGLHFSEAYPNNDSCAVFIFNVGSVVLFTR